MVDVYISDSVRSIEHKDPIINSYPKFREIVASLLTHPESGALTPGEISIETHVMGTESRNPWDFMECDVQVIIRSNKYPWRMEHKDKLAEQIMDAWSVHLPPDVTAWVWLQLLEAGFAKRKMGLEERPLGV